MNCCKFAQEIINGQKAASPLPHLPTITGKTSRQQRQLITDIELRTSFSPNPKPPIEVNENKYAASSRPQGRELIVLIRLRGYLAVPGFGISGQPVPLFFFYATHWPTHIRRTAPPGTHARVAGCQTGLRPHQCLQDTQAQQHRHRPAHAHLRGAQVRLLRHAVRFPAPL